VSHSIHIRWALTWILYVSCRIGWFVSYRVQLHDITVSLVSSGEIDRCFQEIAEELHITGYFHCLAQNHSLSDDEAKSVNNYVPRNAVLCFQGDISQIDHMISRLLEMEKNGFFRSLEILESAYIHEQEKEPAFSVNGP
jgi:hypothetical protein